MSVSFDAELGEAIRAAAGRAGKPVSTWLAEAAATKLRAEALDGFFADYEAEHGAFTPEELECARVEAQASAEIGPDMSALVLDSGALVAWSVRTAPCWRGSAWPGRPATTCAPTPW